MPNHFGIGRFRLRRRPVTVGGHDAGMATDIPDFGRILAPILTRVPDEARPRFLALLERTAAARYRSWAEQLPQDADVLLGCAAREDEIADRIESAFSIDPAGLVALSDLIPGATALYYGTFDGMAVDEQLRLQAAAEQQGAMAWQSIAGRLADERVIAELDRCSELEQTSSRLVTELLGSRPAI